MVVMVAIEVIVMATKDDEYSAGFNACDGGDGNDDGNGTTMVTIAFTITLTVMIT